MSSRGIAARAGLTALLLSACSDYGIRRQVDEAKGGDPDTAVPEDTAPPDTAQDTAVDTGDPVVEDTAGLATEPIYVNTGSTLYSWDPDTGELSLVGDFSDGSAAVDDITDIAIDDAGRLYGVAYDVLYRIEPDSARVWPVTTMAQPMFGLTCVSDGRLVGTGDGVYIIDVSNGALSQVVAPGKYETSGDIVGLPDGLLYWTVRGGDLLVVVDPDNGATTVRGDIGVEKIFGLGYAGGTLYGFASTGGSLGIDPSSAHLLQEADLPGQWWGATTNPVTW